MTSEKGLILSLGDIVLDETTGEILDSGNRVAGTIVGNARPVVDDTFGSCLHFDGKTAGVALSAPAQADLSGGFTIELWAWYSPTTEVSSLFYISEDPEVSLVVEPEGDLYFSLSDQASGLDQLPKERWTHVAVTVAEDGTFIGYSNGQRRIGTQFRAPADASISKPTIGFCSKNRYFHGKLARLRVYDRVLESAEIKADWARGGVAIRSSFEDLHPLSFRLYDEEQRGVIYVHDAGPGHPVTLEVTNESGRRVQLDKPGGERVSRDHHHLELRFRLGALSLATFNAIDESKVTTDGWSAAHEKHPERGTASLYLLKRSSGTLAAADTLTESDTLTVTLDPLSADPTGGARPTPVELHPGPLTRSIDGAGELAPIPGGRSSVVEIVSHRGRKYIPLHVGFVTANTVLNDGSKNDLKLRIKNVSHDKGIPLRLQGESASHFTVSIEHGSGTTADWALTKTDLVKDIHLYARLESGTEILVPTAEDYWRESRPDEQIPKGQWVIGGTTLQQLFPSVEGTAELAAQKSIYLRLSNIKTTHHTGSTSLHVSYADIPGYWGGSFALTIQKSPLVFSEYKVGIGTTDPKSNLSVKGGVAIGATYADSSTITAPMSDLLVEGNVGIGAPNPGSKLSVAGGVSIGVANKTTEAPSNGLLVQGQVDAEGDLNLKGASKILFDSQTGGQSARIFWGDRSPAGELKFGTSKGLWMTVGSATRHERGICFDKDGPVIFSSGDFNLLRLSDKDKNTDQMVETQIVTHKGKVGIGGAPSQAELEVYGDVNVRGDLFGGSLRPSWSKRIQVKNSETYTHDHHLGVIPKLVQIFFSPTKKKGEALHMVSMYNWSYLSGCSYAVTKDTIQVTTGRDNVCLGTDFGDELHTCWTSGWYWVHLWK